MTDYDYLGITGVSNDSWYLSGLLWDFENGTLGRENETSTDAFQWRDTADVLNLCQEDEDAKNRAKAMILYATAPVAAVLILLLSCLKKRRFLWQNILQGRPGILHPVNLLETQELRLSYVAAFCITALQVYDMLLDDDALQYVLSENAPLFVKPLLKFLSCFVLGLIYYPIFAALTSKHWIGYIVGAVYSSAHFGIQFKHSMPCWKGNTKDIAIRSFQILPVYACYVYIALMFIYRAVMNLRLRNSKKKTIEDKLFHIAYVKHLFKHEKPPEYMDEGNGMRPKLLKIVRERIYSTDPSFRYSLTVLAASGLGVTTAYMFAVTALQGFFFSVKYITHFSDMVINNATDRIDYMQAIQMFSIAVKIRGGSFYNVVKEIVFWITIVELCFYTALAISFILIVLSLLASMRNYKRQLCKVFKGKKMTKNENGPTSTLVTMCKYVGFQIGYSSWGFAIQLLVTYLVLFIVVGFFAILIKYDKWKWLVTILETYGPVVVFLILLQLMQRLLAHFVFLQTLDGRSVLALDNRRSFFAFQYFMVFINAALGFFSCLSRLLKGVFFGVWIIPRLDVSTMPRIFERFDPGNQSYIDLLRVENLQRNPILLSFVDIIRDTQVKSTDDDVDSSKDVQSVEKSTAFKMTEPDVVVITLDDSDVKQAAGDAISRRRRVVIRWLVAYTLICNPSLYMDRKRRGRMQMAWDKEKEAVQTIGSINA